MERSGISCYNFVVTKYLLQNICNREFVTRVVAKNNFEKKLLQVVAIFFWFEKMLQCFKSKLVIGTGRLNTDCTDWHRFFCGV